MDATYCLTVRKENLNILPFYTHFAPLQSAKREVQRRRESDDYCDAPDCNWFVPLLWITQRGFPSRAVSIATFPSAKFT